MKLLILSAAALAIAAPAAAFAENAAAPAASVTPKLGATITTSDGKRLGRVDDIHSATKNEAASVGVIYDGRFVFVPVSTLTATDKGYTTSLSLKEVRGK